jgi:hypothetical protein
VFKEPQILERIGAASASTFVIALQFFVTAVALCVLAYGVSFLSHAAYYVHKSLGTCLTVGVALLLLASLTVIGVGCFRAIQGLELGSATLAKK